MLLRASSEISGAKVDLSAVQGALDEDAGVAHGQLLIRFAEAVMQGDPEDVAGPRSALARQLGPAAISDAAGVIAMFNIVDRVADATGIPLDEFGREIRTAIGSELGMDHLSREGGAR